MTMREGRDLRLESGTPWLVQDGKCVTGGTPFHPIWIMVAKYFRKVQLRHDEINRCGGEGRVDLMEGDEVSIERIVMQELEERGLYGREWWIRTWIKTWESCPKLVDQPYLEKAWSWEKIGYRSRSHEAKTNSRDGKWPKGELFGRFEEAPLTPMTTEHEDIAPVGRSEQENDNNAYRRLGAS